MITQKERDFLAGLRLIDDIFMTECLKDISCAEIVLRVILDKPDLIVKTSRTQEKLSSWERAIWLDVYAVDSEGKQYNIEIQRADDGADIRRARFHSAMLDVNSLNKREDFKLLSDSYVIFITEHDIFKLNLPLYTIHRHIDETGDAVNDGTHIIYVNGALRDPSTSLGRLMQDFFERDPKKINYPVLKSRISSIKNTEEGSDSMSNLYESIAERSKLEIATNLIKAGSISLKLISECVGISLEKIQQLAQSVNSDTSENKS